MRKLITIDLHEILKPDLTDDQKQWIREQLERLQELPELIDIQTCGVDQNGAATHWVEAPPIKECNYFEPSRCRINHTIRKDDNTQHTHAISPVSTSLLTKGKAYPIIQWGAPLSGAFLIMDDKDNRRWISSKSWETLQLEAAICDKKKK